MQSEDEAGNIMMAGEGEEEEVEEEEEEELLNAHALLPLHSQRIS